MFLHGYLSSKEAFSAQIAYFSRFFRVTAFDFLGFGESKRLETPFSVGDYAAWTKKVLTLLDVKKPCVVAHSFGCRVAVKMASVDPQIFDKIILTGAAGIIENRGFSYQMKVKTYRLVKKFFPSYAEKKFGSEEYRALSPVMKESYKKIVNEDLREAAKAISNPTLLIQGERDTTTPVSEANIYLQNLQNGSLKIMQGGHFAFVEQPAVFNLLVEEFLYD